MPPNRHSISLLRMTVRLPQEPRDAQYELHFARLPLLARQGDGHDNETGTTARSPGPERGQSKPKAVVGEDEAVLTPRAKPRSRK